MRPADLESNGNASVANSPCSAADPILSIVVPVYRSADCLRALTSAIAEALEPAGPSYEVILVNDGSPDKSWDVIESICRTDPRVIGVDMRRNFGQDNAILTGLRLVRGKYVAIMDDDLQHDPRDLPALLARLESGFDVVFGDFRVKQQKRWKNIGSWLNGKMAEWVLEKPKDIYLSPYKVLRAELAEAICAHRGAEPYIDGLLLQVTSRLSQVPIEHRVRFAGQSNYNFWKSVRLAARVAFSFSVRPLRIVTVLGCVCSAGGILMAIAVILYRLAYPAEFGPAAVGWASLMVVMLFLGGMQMIFFGILGEYAGRTYLRANDQPQAAVREVVRRDVAAGAAGATGSGGQPVSAPPRYEGVLR
jgi:polyisoprenyl-phosphate glycosyltransferase